MAGTDGVLLAGTLEKRGHWKKEWKYRFCVVRRHSIDYFLTAPTYVDDENEESRRGSIPLDAPIPVEEPGRPFCISVGGELLSCGSRVEQQKWLETIGALGGAAAQRVNGCGAVLEAQGAARHPLPCTALRRQPEASPQELRLVLLAPEEPARRISWREQCEVVLAGRQCAATVLITEGSGACSASASYICRLPLYDAAAAEAGFPLQTLAAEPMGLRLCVRVQGNEPVAKGPTASLIMASSSAMAWLCLALALLARGSTAACGLIMLVALGLLILQSLQVPAPCGPAAPRRITFSAERLASAASVAKESLARPALPAPGGAATNGCIPAAPSYRWTGRWRLDKSRSELYEPILADMGVNYLLRKAADAKTSILTITASTTHMTINLKTWVVVEDCIPLDGSWATKAVPPGSRMRGECRVRLSRCSATEVEMLTEFPEPWGVLRDTLTVAADGASFTRRVARSDTLSITRFFIREA